MQNSVLGKSGKFDGPSGEEKEKDTGQLQSPKGKQMEQLQGQLPAPAPTIISSKQIKMGRQIGQGAFGAVHEATCTNAHGSVSNVNYLMGGGGGGGRGGGCSHARVQTQAKRLHARAHTHTHTQNTHTHTYTKHTHTHRHRNTPCGCTFSCRHAWISFPLYCASVIAKREGANIRGYLVGLRVLGYPRSLPGGS